MRWPPVGRDAGVARRAPRPDRSTIAGRGARPSRDRMSTVREVIEGLTDESLNGEIEPVEVLNGRRPAGIRGASACWSSSTRNGNINSTPSVTTTHWKRALRNAPTDARLQREPRPPRHARGEPDSDPRGARASGRPWPNYLRIYRQAGFPLAEGLDLLASWSAAHVRRKHQNQMGSITKGTLGCNRGPNWTPMEPAL